MCSIINNPTCTTRIPNSNIPFIRYENCTTKSVHQSKNSWLCFLYAPSLSVCLSVSLSFYFLTQKFKMLPCGVTSAPNKKIWLWQITSRRQARCATRRSATVEEMCWPFWFNIHDARKKTREHCKVLSICYNPRPNHLLMVGEMLWTHNSSPKRVRCCHAFALTGMCPRCAKLSSVMGLQSDRGRSNHTFFD